MGQRGTMTREEAAAVLGVPTNAPPDDVRHAWRLWARIAHPDAGGEPAHFARLDQARRVLLEPAPRDATVPPPHQPPVPPRAPLTEVVRLPRELRLIALMGVVAVLLAALPAVLGAPPGSIAFALAAAPAAIGAAAWAAWSTRQVATPEADHGHRIMVLSLVWLPVALLQQATAIAAGASLLPVLPLVALPLAAAVSAINPGAGLWRPVGRPAR